MSFFEKGITLITQSVIMSKLVEHICQVIQLTGEEKQRVEDAFSSKALKKGDYWIREGKVCHHVAFLDSGKLRVFYNELSGVEVTCYFFMPDTFISSYTSFLTNTPATENIMAMEDSLLMIISKEEIERLSDEIPKMHVWRRVMAENLFILMEKRIAMLQSKTAHERYDRMIKEDPDILLSVPLQYTASFLGITPQHLSRLRKESQR